MPGRGQFKKTATKRSVQQRKYNSKPSSKKDRASRNKARAAMVASGRARKGDGRDVDHKNGNPRDNSSKNLGMMSKSKNRSKK